MFPVIDLGPFAIQAAGLILLLSLWVGIWLTGKFAEHLGTNGEVIENGLLYALLAGLLGARIGFLLQNPSVFVDNPLSVVSLTPSMLNGAFGGLTAALTLWIAYQKKHLPLWPTLDTFSPLFLMLFAGVQLANYANGNAYGLPTSLPWGVYLWNTTRHPVQLYALFLTVFLLAGGLYHTKLLRQTGSLRSGVLFAETASGLALITVITQAFVAEKTTLLGLDALQVAAVLVLAGSLVLIYTLTFKPRKHIPVFLSLGANRQPEENLRQALTEIDAQFKVRARSGLYRAKDVRKGQAQRDYLNQALEIETTLPYPDLVARLKDLEKQSGREPDNREDVPLDIDILTYNGDVFTVDEKRIPDPGITHYRYIAIPLAEIAPDFKHPATGEAIEKIIASLDETGQPIEKLTEVENGTQR